MPNTMVGGWGAAALGKKIKNQESGKYEKGARKTEENHIKNGWKGIFKNKMHLFGLKNPNFSRKKNMNIKIGGGGGKSKNKKYNQ